MTIKVKTLKTDTITPTNFIKKLHYSFYLNTNILVYSATLFSIFFIKGYSESFLWNHFTVNNLNIFIVECSLITIILFFLLLRALSSNNTNYNLDYFFALNNVIYFLILIIFTNNLFSFIFLLELNSIIIFYKFVVSKHWFKKSILLEEESERNYTDVPKNYLNMLFFQYWSTFFSSVLIFFSLANIFYFYGSSEIFFLNFLNIYNLNNFLFKINFLNFIWFPFFIGFCIKIGLTPFHLFKIEVYKGLPLLSIIAYTTFYFFIYFSYFILIFAYKLDFIKIISHSFFEIMLLSGVFYVATLLFDITALKSFFAYSTIINSLLFFFATLVI